MQVANWFLLVLLLVSALACCPTIAQDEPNQVVGPPVNLVANFKRLSETKLAALKAKFRLSNDEIELIREKMPPIIEKAARLSSLSTIQILDDDLEFKFDMACELKPYLEKEAYESLHSRLELQLKVNNSNAKNHVINFIDRRVWLDPEQKDRVDRWLTENWNSHWNHGATQLGNGKTQYFRIVRSLDQEAFIDMLGEARTHLVFSQPAADINELINMDWTQEGAEDEFVAALKQEYQQVVKFKIDEIRRIAKLDDSSFAKLRVAAIGVSRKIIAAQVSVLKQKDFNQFGLSEKKMAAAMTQPGLALPTHEKWVQGLQSVLDAEQFRIVQEHEEKRLSANHKTLIHEMVARFFIKPGVRERDYQAITERVTRACDLSVPLGNLNVTSSIMEIEPEFWEEHLPKGSWRKIRTQLRLNNLGR